MIQNITSFLLQLTFFFIKIHSLEYVFFCLILFALIALISSISKDKPKKQNLKVETNKPNKEQHLAKEVTPIKEFINENKILVNIKEKETNSVDKAEISTGVINRKNGTIKETLTQENAYKDLPNYEFTSNLPDYKYPNIELLQTHEKENPEVTADELEDFKNKIVTTFMNHGIALKKIIATIGPTFTLYEIVPATDVNISRIKKMNDDLTLRLSSQNVKIIAPIPGKGTIGIEVPNVKRSIVSLRTLLSSEEFKFNNFKLPICIGKRMDNENFIVDLSTMPHLLIAGSTGQGKSVTIDSILLSILYKNILLN